jgi:hypothetical protein
MYFTRKNKVDVHGEGRGSGGKVPCIVKIGNKWNVTPTARATDMYWTGQVSSTADTEAVIEPRFPSRPDSNAVTDSSIQGLWTEFLIINWTIHCFKQSTHTKSLQEVDKF